MPSSTAVQGITFTKLTKSPNLRRVCWQSMLGYIALNELLQRAGREKRKEGIKEGREAGREC